MRSGAESGGKGRRAISDRAERRRRRRRRRRRSERTKRGRGRTRLPWGPEARGWERGCAASPRTFWPRPWAGTRSILGAIVETTGGPRLRAQRQWPIARGKERRGTAARRACPHLGAGRTRNTTRLVAPAPAWTLYDELSLSLSLVEEEITQPARKAYIYICAEESADSSKYPATIILILTMKRIWEVGCGLGGEAGAAGRGTVSAKRLRCEPRCATSLRWARS